MKRHIVRISLALIALLTVGLITATPASASTTVSGYVMCVSESPVVGVWVQAASGGSGWASWYASGTAYNAHYQYALPNGGSYAVHVGCGGTPQNWATANYSGYVSGTYNSFTCYDDPSAGQYYLHCQHT